MKEEVKVSIIMPSLNVGKYIRECMESVVQQTLHEIEIICVDAGSTDGTVEILKEFVEKDPRVQLIHSDIKSYGYQMNLGLCKAKGEYIGIVETDDWVEKDMFEILWNTAVFSDADIVKSNYYWYTSQNGIKNVPFENLGKCKYNQVFRPVDEQTIYTATPSIWSGIYRKRMLDEKGIKFNETPGASYQDTSFYFMTLTVAEKCYLINKYFLHYRRDNEASSVNSTSKVYCVSDEMHYYEHFLNNHIEYREKIMKYYQTLKYEKYRWNFERLAPQFQYDFFKLMYSEFSDAKNRRLLDEKLFTKAHWDAVNLLIDNPRLYFEQKCKIYSTRGCGSVDFKPQIVKLAEVINPKISIIVPIYNCEKYVESAINSLLQQSLKEIEIICIDDGSVDNSLSAIQKLSTINNRITVCTSINLGQSAARNFGLLIARGQYVHFLDADDALEKDALEHLYNQAESLALDVLYFDGKSVYESKNLEKQHPFYINAYEYKRELPPILSGKQLFVFERKDKKFRASACMALYKKSYLDRIGIKFIEGILHEDNSFTIQTMILAEKVAHTKEKYYLRTVHEGSTMTQAKSFRHFYGYLVSMIELIDFAGSISYEEALFEQIIAEINTLRNNTKSTFEKLDEKDTCLKKLSALEKWYFDTLICPLLPCSDVIKFDNELNLIMNSTEYKFATTITSVPRKIKKGIQCYKDNGFSYTFKRVLEHLGIPMGIKLKKK